MCAYQSIDNSNLLSELNKSIKGHEVAKKALITLFNRSYLRYYQSVVMGTPLEDCVSNKSILLIGQSGCGKTFLVDSISNILQVPLIKISATELNPTGAHGGITVKDLKKIIKENAENLFKTDGRYYSIEGIIAQTVVFVDEIDKLGKSFESSGNWNKQVQNNFLKLFENKDEFSSISFIFAGAFSGMGEQTAKKNNIGFFANVDKSTEEVDWSQEVIKYGLTPELVGRISSIVKLDSLTKADYKDVLVNYLLPLKKKELKSFAIKDFSLNDEVVDKITNKALESGQGIRFLIRELTNLSEEIEFNAYCKMI